MNIERAKQEFEKHAKEELMVEEKGGTLYAFGSELATLRLFHKYAALANPGGKFATGYSTGYGLHYFRIET